MNQMMLLKAAIGQTPVLRETLKSEKKALSFMLGKNYVKCHNK